MKRGLILPLVIMLLIGISTVLAQEENNQEVNDNPGVTPDSPVWGIDRALERISLALTFDRQKKEEKRLIHAQERLLEVKAMLEEKNIEDAEKAEKAHEKTINIAKANIEKLSSRDLKVIVKLRNSVDEQESELEEINSEIKIKIVGELTEEQQARLDEFLASLEGSIEKIHVVIKDKEEKSIEETKRKEGKTSEEVINELGELREKKLIRADKFDASSVIKVDQRFITGTNVREEIINEIIEKFAVSREEAENMKISEEDEAEDDFKDRLRIKVERREKEGLIITEVKIILRSKVNTIDDNEIKNKVVELTHLTEQQVLDSLEIKEEEEKDEDENDREIEIKVITKDSGEQVARVRVEWDGFRNEFTIDSSSRDEIISFIAEKLNVPKEEIEAAIKEFEVKLAEEDDFDKDEDEIDNDLKEDDEIEDVKDELENEMDDDQEDNDDEVSNSPELDNDNDSNDNDNSGSNSG